MKYWEIIADKIAASGWAWGYCTVAAASGSRYIVDAHCGDGCRFIVEADELLTAFLELEARCCAEPDLREGTVEPPRDRGSSAAW